MMAIIGQKQPEQMITKKNTPKREKQKQKSIIVIKE